jgi:hypothetical protein
VVAGALLLSGLLVLVGADDLRGDQHVYNLLVVKLLDSSVLARDVLYRHDPTLLHVPWFLHLHAAVARGLGGDVEAALAWLAWPMGTLYLVGHYALFRALTGHPGAAALAALGALTIRNSLGGEFWGYDGVRAAATRTILAGAIPALLLLWMRWRGRRSFPLYYGLLGLLFNVHPVSAYHLAQATGLAHAWLERFQPRALVQLAAGAALFGLGTLPYVVPFFGARADAVDASTLSLARAALDHRFPYLLYPIAPAALLSVAFHMAPLAAVWLWWRRRRETTVLGPLETVAAAAVVLAFGATALVQALGVWRDRPYLDIQELRMTRLVYPVLLAALALAYARLLARRTWRARAAVAVLVALSLVPPGSVIHAFGEERREAVKRALGMAVPRSADAAPGVDARPALWAWAAATTPGGSLFFTDDWDFRVETRRSITGSYKDGAFLFLAGNRPFTAWYRLDREMAACRAARGHGCWFELAGGLGADYVVVDPALTAARPPSGAERVWAHDGWSVWRLAAAPR